MGKGLILDKEILKYALIGGAILGGGGGGAIESGAAVAQEAFKYGNPRLISIDEIPEDTIIITASAVGAPAAINKYITPEDYVKTIELFQSITGIRVGGIITNENGGNATINGWIQSAKLNIPLIDAPCNGRAHPTGTMGSMGLNNLKDYTAYQVAIGGNPNKGMYVESFFKGSIENTSKLVRQTSIAAGGVAVVARNPVNAKYVKENGAVGGITHAIDTGKAFYKGLEDSPEKAIYEVCNFLKGELVVKGIIDELQLSTTGGFDVGIVKIKNHELTFWNEYMTLERDTERIATFPDLIMTFDLATGTPVTSAEIKKGQSIAVINVDKENLCLGQGMREEKLIGEIERIIGKEVLKYVFK